MIRYAIIDNMGNLNLVIDINCGCSLRRKLKCNLLKGGIVEVICSCGKKVFLKGAKVDFS